MTKWCNQNSLNLWERRKKTRTKSEIVNIVNFIKGWRNNFIIPANKYTKAYAHNSICSWFRAVHTHEVYKQGIKEGFDFFTFHFVFVRIISHGNKNSFGNILIVPGDIKKMKFHFFFHSEYRSTYLHRVENLIIMEFQPKWFRIFFMQRVILTPVNIVYDLPNCFKFE